MKVTLQAGAVSFIVLLGRVKAPSPTKYSAMHVAWCVGRRGQHHWRAVPRTTSRNPWSASHLSAVRRAISGVTAP